MAHFFRPADAKAQDYVEKKPVGLALVTVPVNASRDVLLYGGYDGAGTPLVVRPNDSTSLACPVGFTEISPLQGSRRFRLSAVSLGSTMVEARLGVGGPVWDFVQVKVVPPAMVHQGPKLGRNAPIPPKYHKVLHDAIAAAWKLAQDHNFVETFRHVTETLSGDAKELGAYADALDRMTINLLEGAKDSRLAKGLAQEQEDIRDHAVSGAAPAYSFRYEPNIWIRTSAFKKGVKQVTSCIFHEAAHVAGARGDIIAEFALDVLHRAGKIPR